MDSLPKRVPEEGEGMPPAAPSPVTLLLWAPVGLLGSQKCQDLAVRTRARTHTHAPCTKGHKLLVLLCDRDKCCVCELISEMTEHSRVSL